MDIGIVLTSSVAASAFTLLVTHLKERFAKERRALGALYGMAAEIELSERYASAYLKSVSEGRSIWSPAYRVPTEFTSEGLPSLNGEGFLTKKQMFICVEWYAAATELNRCLDSVANFVARDGGGADDPLSGVPLEGMERKIPYGERETERTTIKCKNVLEFVPGAKKAVREAIQFHGLAPLD